MAKKEKTYAIKFDCLIPCEITTVVQGESVNEVYEKIQNNDFENFRYKTKGKMYNISNIEMNELNI